MHNHIGKISLAKAYFTVGRDSSRKNSHFDGRKNYNGSYARSLVTLHNPNNNVKYEEIGGGKKNEATVTRI